MERAYAITAIRMYDMPGMVVSMGWGALCVGELGEWVPSVVGMMLLIGLVYLLWASAGVGLMALAHRWLPREERQPHRAAISVAYHVITAGLLVLFPYVVSPLAMPVQALFGTGREAALMRAADLSHMRFARQLLEAGADPYAADETGKTAFSISRDRGDTDMLSLFEAAAAGDPRHALAELGMTGTVGDLVKAIKMQQPDLIRKLLDFGVEINTKDYRYEPLFEAAVTGNRQIVEMLLDAGAEIDHRSVWGGTALFGAISLDHLELVQLLLAKGADPSLREKSGRTTFAYVRSAAVAKILIERGADIESTNSYHQTPLMAAAGGSAQRDVELVELLIAAGANLEYKDKEGTTALILAARKGSATNLRALLTAGAKVDARGKNGTTALHEAVREMELEAIEILLDAGADPMIEDNAGLDAFYWAKWTDNPFRERIQAQLNQQQ